MGTTQVKVEIVEEIIHDLNDRSGLGDEWDQIDKFTQSEIRQKWEYIVEKHILILNQEYLESK